MSTSKLIRLSSESMISLDTFYSPTRASMSRDAAVMLMSSHLTALKKADSLLKICSSVFTRYCNSSDPLVEILELPSRYGGHFHHTLLLSPYLFS